LSYLLAVNVISIHVFVTLAVVNIIIYYYYYYYCFYHRYDGWISKGNRDDEMGKVEGHDVKKRK
jgi:nicotinamide riboside transporter PnuC